MKITPSHTAGKFILKTAGLSAAALLSLASIPKTFAQNNDGDKFVHTDFAEASLSINTDSIPGTDSYIFVNDDNNNQNIQNPAFFYNSYLYTVNDKSGYNNNLMNDSYNLQPEKKLSWLEMVDYKLGKLFTFTSKKDIEAISKQTGVSVYYLQNVLMKEEKFRRRVYDDGVKDNSDDKGGTLTVGYGHTGFLPGKYFMGEQYNPAALYEINEENRHDIFLSRKDAYEILVTDLLKMKKDAELLFGESFTIAPQSVKDGIVDLIFNKGVSKTFNNTEQPAYKTKQDLANGDYVAVISDLMYDTAIQGIKKRNIYRIKAYVMDLLPEDRQNVREGLEPYYKSVQNGYKIIPFSGLRETGSKIYNRLKVKQAWNSAFKSDKCKNL